MMSFIKSSPLAFAAYHVSSVVTVVQMSVASVAAPETYEFVMDKLALVTVPAWDFTVSAWNVAWEYLNLP